MGVGRQGRDKLVRNFDKVSKSRIIIIIIIIVYLFFFLGGGGGWGGEAVGAGGRGPNFDQNVQLNFDKESESCLNISLGGGGGAGHSGQDGEPSIITFLH